VKYFYLTIEQLEQSLYLGATAWQNRLRPEKQNRDTLILHDGAGHSIVDIPWTGLRWTDYNMCLGVADEFFRCFVWPGLYNKATLSEYLSRNRGDFEPTVEPRELQARCGRINKARTLRI
jgi:hypothetical protein